ncbi:hypothetical protein F4225_05705 [Candidatus Poribacteria bacterium]|nr:hypothetical protein [Candidatus Poribacteria bacterium]
MKILNLILTFLPLIDTLYLFVSFSTTTFSQEHFQLSLPAGAKSRIGKGEIHQLKYFPNSKRIAVATSIGIWVYDVKTGDALDLLIGHTSPVKSMVFSPDGETLATGGENGTIILWETNSGKHKATLKGHKSYVEMLGFSPSGKMLASFNSKVFIWDLTSGEVKHTIQSDASTIFALVFSPDEKVLKTIGDWGDNEFYIEYWDVQSGESIKDVLLNDENYTVASLSPDGKTLACAGDSPLQFWNIETTEQLSIDTESEGQFDYVEFSTDGSHLVAADAWNYLSLWQVSPMQLMKNFAHGKDYNSLAYAPDGKTVAAGNDNGSVNIWDVTTGKRIQTIPGHPSKRIHTAAFSTDSSTVTIGTKSELQIWNWQTGELDKTIPEPRCDVYSVSYSQDKNLIATAGSSKKARIWDAQTGRFLGSFVGHKDNIYAVDFSPDGRLLATGGGQKRRRPELKNGSDRDNSVCLWDIRRGELYLIGERLAAFTEHTDWVNAVAFSPDGKTLVSCGQDKTIQLWEIQSLKHLRTLAGHEDSVNAIAFSPDGKTLVSGSTDGTILLWHYNIGELILPPIEVTGQVTSLNYSPDGSLLVCSTYYDHAVHVLDAKTGESLYTYTGHTGRINAVVFSPDGKTLASVSNDCTVLMWDIQNTVANR